MVTLPGNRKVYTSKDLTDDIKLAQAMLDRHNVKRRYSYARAGGILYRLLEQVGVEVKGVLSYSEWQEVTRGNVLTLGFGLWKSTALLIARSETEETDGDSESASPEQVAAGGDAPDHAAPRP